MADVFSEVDFFLIFGEAIRKLQAHDTTRAHGAPEEVTTGLKSYFLNKLSNAARASLALRGAGIMPEFTTFAIVAEGMTSRATVTRGANNWQVFS